MSNCHILEWLHAILFVSLLLTEVAPCCFRCFTTTPWGKCVSIYVYHFCYLVWICILLIFPLLITEVNLFHFSLSMSLIRVAFHGLKCPSASHCGDSVSFHVSQQCSLRRLFLLLGVPLLISRVTLCPTRYPMILSWLALCHFTCFTITDWGGPTSSQMSHWCLLRLYYVIPGFPLQFTIMALHHFRCPYLFTEREKSASFHVFHCH